MKYITMSSLEGRLPSLSFLIIALLLLLTIIPYTLSTWCMFQRICAAVSFSVLTWQIVGNHQHPSHLI